MLKWSEDMEGEDVCVLLPEGHILSRTIYAFPPISSIEIHTKGGGDKRVGEKEEAVGLVAICLSRGEREELEGSFLLFSSFPLHPKILRFFAY